MIFDPIELRYSTTFGSGYTFERSFFRCCNFVCSALIGKALVANPKPSLNHSSSVIENSHVSKSFFSFAVETSEMLSKIAL